VSRNHESRGRKTSLTPETRKVVERMVGDGASNADIARAFAVHPSTVSRWRAGLLRNEDQVPEPGSLDDFIAYMRWETGMRDRIYAAYHSGDTETRDALERELSAQRIKRFGEGNYVEGEW
jgi:IS30 family transposase